MIRLYSFFLACLCAATGVFGQANHVTQAIEWTSVNVNIGLTRKIGLVNDGNFRFAEGFQSQQHQLRSGLEISLSKKLSIVALGYSYIWNFRYGEQPAKFVNNEFRFWQQIQYKHKIGRVSIGHRLRLEERSIEKHHIADGVTIGDGYSNEQFRLRYRFNTTLPLMKTPDAASFYYLNVWDEVHYSHDYANGSNIKYTNTPSQNRLFLGVGYQFSKSTSFQTGFLYQWLKKDNGFQSENNLGILLQFNYAFSLVKAKS